MVALTQQAFAPGNPAPTAFVSRCWRLPARLLWLAAELLSAAFSLARLCALRSTTSAARSRWLQRCSKRVLRIFGAELTVTGPIPKTGLLVSNHLSYLDVLVLGALAPAVFVAKREVKHWPVFGWFACAAGTLFTDREKRSQVRFLTAALRAVLQTGALVVLFPEGTSSNGQTVLPFKSALLEPAAAADSLPIVSAAFIEYHIDDGDAGEEVCYWKDMTFLPHLGNLLGKRRVSITVRFSELPQPSRDRKELARQLHAELLRLKARSSLK